MGQNTLSYALVVFICTLIVFKDIRIRFLNKDRIKYRIKDYRKTKILFYGLGMIVPIIIIVLGVLIEHDNFAKFLIVIMALEMAMIWTMIELGDSLITDQYIGKVWYTRIEVLEKFDLLHIQNQHYLVIKKTNHKRQEMLRINPEDKAEINTILKALMNS